MDKEYLTWLAGLIDGEGSFVISFGIRTPSIGRTPSVVIQFKAVIGLRSDDRFILEEIKDRLNMGKLYLVKNGEGVHWTTTKNDETVAFCNLIEPHLRLKQVHCRKLRQALILWMSNDKRLKAYYKMKGNKTRTQEEMLNMLRLSEDINTGRVKSGKRRPEKVKEIEELIKTSYPKEIS